ncbi:MAG: hypothetical protein IJT44_13550 [Clostridia bacterium]|nr:hypothetical protein [Clostridia bacterium]
MCVFNDYRLTGGIFFALLVDSMKKSGVLSRSIKKNKRISENDVLRDLFCVFNPSFEYVEGEEQSKVTRCSWFKKCATDERTYFLNNGAGSPVITKETVLSNFQNHLTRFDIIFNNYNIKSAHAKPFVYRLLAFLSMDDSIPANEPLYVQEDGTALTKDELLKSKTINFNSFVFGIWLFVCFRHEDNTIGQATYDHFWKPKTEQHSIRVFVDSYPIFGSEFVDLTVLFPKEAKKNVISNPTRSSKNDKAQNEDSCDERFLNKYDLACINQLQADFDSLLPFCINNNPFKMGVFDNGELTSIKKLIEKWEPISLSIEYLPFKTVVQDLVYLLEQYVSFYSDPHIAYIQKKKINAFIPIYENDFQKQEYSKISGYAVNNRHLRRVYDYIYHRLTSE